MLCPHGKKLKKSLGSFFKESVASSVAPIQLEDIDEAELNSYLMNPATDGEEDLLVWWKVQKINFA